LGVFFSAPRRYVDENIGNERQLVTDFVIEVIHHAGELLDINAAVTAVLLRPSERSSP
jgi:hypothetical protein